MTMLECKLALACVTLIMLAAAAGAQEGGLADIVPEGAEMEKVVGDLRFTEGPAWDGKGALYFTDIPADRIYKLDADGQLSVFLEPSRNANGLMFDDEGYLLACRHEGRDLVRISPEGEVETLADSYNGKKLNSPNDLIIAKDGSIYFTDPRYGLAGRAQEQEVEGVYRRAPDGTVTRVVDDMTRPNGIFISLDGRTLLVADTEESKIRAYPIQADGSVGAGRDFIDMDRDNGRRPDGMTMDERGNIYCTSRGGIWVIDPAGELLGVIEVPEPPANCTFGGADLKTLYATARTSVYRMKLKVAGCGK
ncbi:MAG: SMP-30/gluconolactonase/LRE family protein [Armatimonadota bacterium]